MRLNGWQRIGIIASVIWAIVGAIWGILETKRVHDARAGYAFSHVYGPCRDQPGNDPDNVCFKQASAAYNAVPEESGWNIVALALIPIPIAWLIVYGFVVLGRWVRRGFAIARAR